MRRSPAWALDVAIFTVVLVVLGVLLVPSHRISIWMDDEFTGFVAPMANRMAEGMVLYDDGGHLPIPPLSLVFIRVLSDGEATWLLGSLWNYVFKCAALLLLYATLLAVSSRRVAFLATLSGIPFFLALPKTVLYDSMSQFLVAAVMAATVYALGLFRGEEGEPQARGVVFTGCLLATLLLTKQSNGIGALAGTALAFTLFPRGKPVRDRVTRVAFLFGSAALCFLLWCILLSPYVSISGMLTDVFLTGSQPKGGPLRMIVNLRGYSEQIAFAWPMVVLGVLVLVAYVRFRRPLVASSPEAPPFARAVAIAAAFAGILLAVSLPGISASELRLVRSALAWGGFGLLLLVMLGVFVRPPWRFLGRHEHSFAVLGFIAMPAAVGYSLSDSSFRWVYDNNPLILIALAVGYCAFLSVVSSTSLSRVLPGTAVPALAGTAILTLCCWTHPDRMLAAARDCSETWPEIAHLAGARLRPSAAGMRELVALVRQAAPAPSDAVLLLPNDPNVEEWFERPRPSLSSPMIFTDQYWDRYVAADFQALERDPPKVVIIGPRGYWRRFTARWHPGWGAERLIDRVREELLPSRYRLLAEHPIRFQKTSEIMDVYIRDSPASAPD